MIRSGLGPTLLRTALIAIFLTLSPPVVTHAAPKDFLTLTMELFDVSGEPLADLDEVTIETSPYRWPGKQIDFGKAVQVSPGKYQVKVAKSGTGGEGVPIEGHPWRMAIRVRRFRPEFLGPLLLAVPSGSQEITREDQGKFRATIQREPAEWKPEFRCSADFLLEPAFAPLAKALNTDVYMLQHGFWRDKPPLSLGKLSGSGLSDPASEPSTELDRARVALLNLYHALGGGNSCGSGTNWFHYVKSVHVIDEERFIALADKTLMEAVKLQSEQYPGFACNTSVGASSTLHHFTDPNSRYWRKDHMEELMETASIKTPLCQGNVQVTVARFGAKDPEFLVDFDIDDHLDLLLHSADVSWHRLTNNRTNAFEMGEMLSSLARNLQIAAGVSKPVPSDRGYKLVPNDGGRRTPACRDEKRIRMVPR